MMFLSSCKQVVNERSIKTEQSNIQYSNSLDTSRTLHERLKAINKSLNLSQKNDSIRAEKLYQKQFLHFSLSQYDSVIAYSKEMEKNEISYRDNSYLGKQHHLIGYYYDEISKKFDSAFYHYNLSKSYFLKISDSTNIGRRLISMGLIQKNQNDFFGSKETLTEALQFLNFQNDSRYIATCYNALATNHRKLLNYPDAIAYYLKAIERTDSKKHTLIYQNNLAATYIDANYITDAITLLNITSLDPLLIQEQSEKARVLDNLAYARWLSGFAIAVNEFQNPLRIRVENNDRRGQIASYTHLGEVYSNTNPQMAESYFDSVIQLSRTLKIPRAEKDALKFLMHLQPRNIEFRDRYVFLQDSLYAQELKVKTQFAKYKYDDKLKQESILRLEKEKAEKALEASQQRNQKIIYLGGSLFLASILGLSLYSFRQRTKRLKQENKTARLEASFETEGALSRKLHDDYGGKLNYTISLVQNGADASVILDNLESLNDQNRDFSRVINEIDTGQYYKDELMGMLGSRKPLNTKLFTSGLEEFDWSVLPALTKTTLFKVLQELMINMTRHSKAETVALTLETGSNGLQINYEDDGVGASKKELQVKNGLRNTEKRIQAIGGTITFDSDKGNGFRAEIHIPT